jgi:hypothetical protein
MEAMKIYIVEISLLTYKVGAVTKSPKCEEGHIMYRHASKTSEAFIMGTKSFQEMVDYTRS